MNIRRTQSTSKNTRTPPNTRPDAPDTTDTSRSGAPLTLRLAGGVAALEALGAVGVGVWMVAEALIQRPSGLGIALGSGGFVLAAGIALAVLAWGLFRAERWSRSPTVVCQLIMLPLGYELLSGTTTAFGAGMLVVAVATLILVLLPSSTAVFK